MSRALVDPRPRGATSTAAPMLIRLTKLTNERHRFEVLHGGRSLASRELETRSLLLHDLVHYAVETEAGLRDSFYGRLAAGVPYDALAMADAEAGDEALATERVVAMLQSAARRGDWSTADPAALVARLDAGFRALGEAPPAWLTPEAVGRARERLRQVLGRWRATQRGGALELEY